MPPRAPAPARALALAALLALAHAQQLCDTMHAGNETEFAFRLPERRVEPDMFTLEISVPHVCSDSPGVGLKVTACDTEQAPRVYLLDTTRGLVLREGSVATAASVYITVYCGSESDEASGESVASPIVSNWGYEEALLPSSSILSPPLPPPFTEGSTSKSAEQPLPNSIPDSLPQSGDEPSSALSSSTEEYLPPMQLESRFYSLGQSKDPSLPLGAPARFNDLWKGRTAPLRQPLQSQPFLQSPLYRFQENDMTKRQPSKYDSHSLAFPGLPQWPQDPSSLLPDKRPLSLAKRLTASRPQQPQKLLANRSPAWLKRPTRRPSSPWRRSLTEGETRKYMPRSHNYPMSPPSEYGDSRSPYDDDSMSPHWPEERMDPNSWYVEGEPQSHKANHAPVSWRAQHPSSIKHISKKQTRHVPPIHEEDPALLAEWNKDLHRSPHSSLPKLLLLLPDQDHAPPLQRKCAEHSAEDADPWWLNKQNADDDIPWAPDYPTDYSADDGGSRSQFSGRYTDERQQSSRVAQSYKEESRCQQCLPERSVEARKQPRVQYSPQRISETEPSPQGSPRPPPDSVYYYGPTPLTERPMVTSTIRHVPARHKSSKSGTAMKLKQATSMAAELSEQQSPAAQWNFLSQLLLSHPAFRDSTHVIRVR